MQVDALQDGFTPGIKVPAVLTTLCDYTEQSKGQTSCDFALTDDGYNALLDAFDEDEEAADQFVVFGSDQNSSLYGYWLYAGRGIDEAPIVYLESEGSNCTVLANDMLEFLTLLALGEREVGRVKSWGVPDRPCPGLDEFRAWLKANFGIEPPTQAEARAIVDRARAAHPDLDGWMRAWAKAHLRT